MGFLNKTTYISLALCALFALIAFNFWLDKNILKIQNEIFKKSNKELIKKADELTTDKATLKANLAHCDATISSQNQAIKEAIVKVDNTPIKEVEQIKKIYVKDKSCEAELKAYKELFLDFADEQGPSLRPAPSAGPRTKDLSDLADKIKGKK